MGKKLKRHLSIDGQIAKLSSRGLIIEDEDLSGRGRAEKIQKNDYCCKKKQSQFAIYKASYRSL